MSVSSDSAGSDHTSKTVCHLCRQRKTKCDRKLPHCSFCLKAKVVCRYVDRPKKRGLRAGYVSELESRIEKLESELSVVKASQDTVQTRLSAPPSITTPSWSSISHQSPTVQEATIAHKSYDGGVTDAADAVKDLMTFPRVFYITLADQWFKEYSAWAPFLERSKVNASLSALPEPVNRIDDIVLKAIMSIGVAYSSQAICLGYNGRRRLSLFLRSQVLIEAMGNPCLSSVQSLLIIALLDYGSDEIPSVYSLMAIIRRMAENIGIFRQLLNRIEGESPAQVGPPAREHCGDEIAIAVTWCILALDAVSSLGVPWRDASAALIDHLSSVAYISTPDFRDSFRTHTHLAAIGLQPVHEFIHSFALNKFPAGRDTSELCEEMYQNLMGYIHGLPETSYTVLADGGIDFDPSQLFTLMLSHGVIILIYQRYVFDEKVEVAQTARTRCFESRKAIVNLIRNVSDTDTEVNSPLLATWILVPARYELTMSRAGYQTGDTHFDMLMHGLNMCGRRWPIARRMDIVLRAAFHEINTGQQSSLPPEFWDLTKSHLDISDAMKNWLDRYKPTLYVGSLNGPYV